jgi:hypothetical protein
LPGRVHASCEISCDEAGEVAQRLSLDKDGKDWSLYVYTHFYRTDETSDAVLLRDAAVSTKAAAVAKFPALLDAIAQHQQAIVEYAKTSAANFDSFAKAIGLKGGA